MQHNANLAALETELKLRGFSPRTVKTYLFYNKKFLEFTKKEPKDATEDDIRKYLAGKMSSGEISTSSIALMKAALKFFYDDLLKKGIVNIKAPKISNKLPVVLTRAEIKRLIDCTTNEKHRLMLLLLYSSGLRLSECINLKYGDIDLEDGMGWVRSGKGKKDRMFILSEKLRDALKKEAKSSDYVFTGRNGPIKARAVQKLVENAAKRAKIDKPVHVHTLRHTFATHLLENGTDIRKIQKLLGHSNLQTTQIYTSVSTEELKKVKSPMDNL
ncbi:MAG: site-specific tyrosine recombinase/integron integrase [Nanoarchaeota archaeon]|nr:tyrosine-type recombinase/integrase [Nanoarchaeota archaeon]MBU4299947.1 tyrosine-type recombinase/integrase [Nanoarchaeota archaeon]MBU4452248.1 tyrosine-type recombinase/integrase [Nanoarchaeota archaeon]MCG2723675.1 tyrosine-type recombinase/integrase [archaeon]